MEVLSDILRGIRARGSVYFCDYLLPPWQLPYHNEARAMFHFVRRGACTIEIDDTSYAFERGDFAFIAPAVDHTLVGLDGSDKQTLLLCGYCRFDVIDNDILMQALPRYVILGQDKLEQWPWLLRTLEHLSAEYLSEAPGSELTVNKLTEVLLVQLLRADFGRNEQAGLIAALKDKRLARALAAIHENPGNRWTLEMAAQVANLSRSGFARLFSEMLGVRFYDYLTRLRMRQAREMLESTALSIEHIAEKAGYQSPLSFVSVYRKWYGQTPNAWRKSSQQLR